MATSLDRPGVQVEQELQTSSPTLAQPTLIPLVVGPCLDIVEATDSKGGINSKAQLITPALLTTSAGATFAVGKRDFELIVNNGVAQKIALPGSANDEALTPQAIINAINGVITGVVATVSGTGASQKIVLRTSSTGDAAKLEVGSNTHANVLTAFGFKAKQIATGAGSYKNAAIKADPANFPVNKGNVSERTVDTATIRAFIKVSGKLVELKDDESVLVGHKAHVKKNGGNVVNATSMTVQNDDASSANSPEVAADSVEAHAQFGSTDTKDGGAHKSAFFIEALKAGDANGFHGNNVSWVLNIDNATAVLTIDNNVGGVGANPPSEVFGGAVTWRISVDKDTHADVDAFVTALNGHATFKKHFKATSGTFGQSAAASSTDAMTEEMSCIAVPMRGGLDPIDFQPGVQNNPSIASKHTYVNDSALGKTLKFRVNGGEEHTVTFTTDSAPQDIDDVITDIDADKAIHGLNADKAGAKLTLAIEAGFNTKKGHESTIEITGGTAIDDLFGVKGIKQASRVFNTGNNKGLVVTARAGSHADGLAGNSVISNLTVNAGAGALAVTLDSQSAPTNLDIVIGEDHATVVNYEDLRDALNADNEFNQNFVASLEAGSDGSGVMVDGDDVGDGALAGGTDDQVDNATGLAIVGVHHGQMLDIRKGDELWSGGVSKGQVTEVKDLIQGARTHSNAVLKLDTEHKDATVFKTWYVVAKELPSTGHGTSVPTPDLVVDGDGSVNLKHHVHRDSGGVVVPAADVAYLQYDALRLDVTAKGASPKLQRFSNTTDLDASLGPINQKNPLALGLSMAMLNAPTIEVSGFGVAETSKNAPDGTLDGYAEAFDWLEASEVYAIAPLTQDETVHQTASTHVSALSAAAKKKERMAVVAGKEPSHKAPTTIASGLDGETTNVAQEFQVPLGEANIVQELTDLGLADPQNPTVSDAIYLVTQTSARKFSVSGVTAGNVVTVRKTFADGENDDNFYTTDDFPTSLLNEDWTMYQRGAAITDKTDIVTAMQAIASAYGNRRLVWVQPENCLITIDGLNQTVGSHFACAAIVGQIAQQNPSQPLTNFPVAGLVGVQGSHDKYSETQLSIGAGGGVYWLIQDADGAPVISRHQLTTDLSSVETRELSILKSIDFTAKFLRGSLKRFVGRYVITDQLLNMLGIVAQGVFDLLRDSGVIAGGDVTKVVADSTQPDKVLLDVEIKALYPCNTIRVTIVV